MPAQPTFSDQDYELLSAYLDGQLTTAEQAALETRLEVDAALRGELAALRQTVALVRGLPVRRAPRNFTLTPAMAGTPRLLVFPTSAAFSALSAVAAMVLVLAGFALLGQSGAGVGRQNIADNAQSSEVALGPTNQPSSTLMIALTIIDDGLLEAAETDSAATPVPPTVLQQATAATGRSAAPINPEPGAMMQPYDASPAQGGMEGAANSVGEDEYFAAVEPRDDNDEGPNNGVAAVGAAPPQPAESTPFESDDETAVLRTQTTQEGAAETMMMDMAPTDESSSDAAGESNTTMSVEADATEPPMFEIAMQAPSVEAIEEQAEGTASDLAQAQAPSLAVQATNLPATSTAQPTMTRAEPTATLQPTETSTALPTVTTAPTETAAPTATVTPTIPPGSGASVDALTFDTLGALLIGLGAVALIIAVLTTLARRRR